MTLSPLMHRAVVGFPLDTLPNHLDSTLNSTLNQFFSNSGRSSYPVDVREDADHFYVEAELPGFKKDEIDITLKNTELTITAEHKAAVEPTPAKGNQAASSQPETPQPTTLKQAHAQPAEWLLSERRLRSFHRTFELPPTVDAANVTATVADGILSIVLNKRQETKPRKITVG